MAQVIVRNLDAVVVDTLKKKAKLRGCSLEQELRDVLSEAATMDGEERAAVASRIRAMSTAAKSDSTDLIREDRDAR